MPGNFVVIAAAAGVLSFLTPCVFPMVPVTLGYFGGDAKQSSRAGWFAAGIIVTFTLVGVLSSAVVGAAALNRVAADPRVNLAIAALFVLFAANLFGLFELPIPSGLLTRLTTLTSGAGARGAAGAALVGAVFTITSLTCTAPFVGTLLVLAARGETVTPLLGMLVFSAAFALPFYLLARVPGLLGILPRSGSWMRSLKTLVGALELAFAAKFAATADVVAGWGIVTREALLGFWLLLGVAVVAFLIVSAVRHHPGRAFHSLAAAGIALVSLPVALALSGRATPLEIYLPPDRATALVGSDALIANMAPAAGEDWIVDDLPLALRTAAVAGKPVFIDFSGYTCTNCRWMEAHVFNRADVRAELGGFVLSRLYTDGEGPVYERQQSYQERRFGTVALPLYAVLDPDGAVRDTLAGITRDPMDFLAFLRRAGSRAGLVAGNFAQR